jgi:hypothetical protein
VLSSVRGNHEVAVLLRSSCAPHNNRNTRLSGYESGHLLALAAAGTILASIARPRIRYSLQTVLI